MNAKQAKALRQDPELLKRLAKYVALYAFRNTELENLHAGISPSSATGDFSDVKVVSPFGEIPWPQVSRFSDEEMKPLMIDVVNHTYMVMFSLFGVSDMTLQRFLDTLVAHDPQPEWEEPRMPFRLDDPVGGLS
jgi:hypothetical protein